MIKLLIIGDFIPPNSQLNIFSKDLLAELHDKDFSIVNLEAPITESNKAILKNGNSFKLPKETIKQLKKGAFDAVSLSNNHVRDFGNDGVIDTLEICSENNIETVGAGITLEEASKPLRLYIKNKKISILNYSESDFNIANEDQAGANPYDSITAYNLIQREKNENDFVIVIYHGGIEYQHYPTLEIVKQFKFLIDIGADSVVSHHTHRYSGILIHNEKPIVFGLGNFLASTITRPTKDWLTGIAVRLKISDESIDFEIVPTTMNTNFNHVKTISNDEKKYILKHIDELSKVISDNNSLGNYWNSLSQYDNSKFIRLIKSNNKFEYRLRKYLPYFFHSNISKYRLINILSIIRNSSQRECLISTLLREYKMKE